ncbi:MAG: GAF domain-containing protein [Actinomycetota bacterium]
MSYSSPVEREAERLALLASTPISPDREARFNELIDLAAFIAHTPMASISVVEADSIWFKAALGFDPMPMDRADVFCDITAGRTTPLIVNDASLDPAFADRAIVRDEGVRFYAGFPLLVHDDLAIGTLCVFDRRPRNLLSDELHALRVVADQAATQLRVNRLEAMLRDGD